MGREANWPPAVADALLAAKWFLDHLDYYHVDRNKRVITYPIAAIVNGHGPGDSRTAQFYRVVGST